MHNPDVEYYFVKIEVYCLYNITDITGYLPILTLEQTFNRKKKILNFW